MKDPKNAERLSIWCSTLRRSISTAETGYNDCLVPPRKVTRWRALAEINAGTYDGLTYAEIEKRDPLGYQRRNKDKLNYQYPQGESYKDVIDRVERVIFELERVNHPVLVVAHQAVIRCLYGYFTEKPLEDIPHQDIPIHTVIKLIPGAYGCREERYPLAVRPHSAVLSPLCSPLSISIPADRGATVEPFVELEHTNNQTSEEEKKQVSPQQPRVPTRFIFPFSPPSPLPCLRCQRRDQEELDNPSKRQKLQPLQLS